MIESRFSGMDDQAPRIRGLIVVMLATAIATNTLCLLAYL
jgi:hypothetical protein